MYLTFPCLSLHWVCPILTSYREPITNDSCSLFFLSTADLHYDLNCKCGCLRFITVFFVNVPSTFDKHTKSPIHRAVTVRWHGKIWRVDSETFPGRRWCGVAALCRWWPAFHTALHIDSKGCLSWIKWSPLTALPRSCDLIDFSLGCQQSEGQRAAPRRAIHKELA